MGSYFRWFFFASASFVLLLQLRGFDSALITSSTPYGILGYEIAFTAARAEEILVVWRSMDVLDTVRTSLAVDMVFLLVYPWFFRSSIRLLLGMHRQSSEAAAEGVGGATVEGAVAVGSERSEVRPRPRARSGWFFRLGGWLAVAVLFCIPLDFAENMVLWSMLERGVTPAGAMTSGVVATLKFGLVIVSALWCFGAILGRLFRRH